MKNFLLCLFILFGSSAVFSQTPKLNDGIYTIAFADGSKFVITEFVNLEKLPVSVGGIKIYNKTVKGVLFDFGEPSFSISRNTLAAISKVNKSLALQIKTSVYMGIAIEQNADDIIRIHGFRSIKNLKQLSACRDTKKICRIEAQVVLVEVKMKDKTENFVLAKTMKPIND